MVIQYVFNYEFLKLRNVSIAMLQWIGPVNLLSAIVLIAPYRRVCVERLLALTCKQHSVAKSTGT